MEGHLPVLCGLLGRRAGDDAGRLSRWCSSRSPPACGRRTRHRRRWPAASGSAGCGRSGPSPWARPGWPSSAARSWWRWSCLAEFGAFEILGYQTLTTEIYNEFQVGFNEPAACALSLILVLLGAMLLAGEGSVRGQGRTSRAGRRSGPRSFALLPLGRLRPVAFGGVALLVVLALGVPGRSRRLPDHRRVGAARCPRARRGDATLNTFGYGAAAGVVATLAAVPIALLSVRFPRRNGAGLDVQPGGPGRAGSRRSR